MGMMKNGKTCYNNPNKKILNAAPRIIVKC
jgi:hypothetical protein